MKNSQSIRSLLRCQVSWCAGLKGLFGDRYARVIQLKRRKNSCVLLLWATVPGAL